jgi:hypothetical protein
VTRKTASQSRYADTRILEEFSEMNTWLDKKAQNAAVRASKARQASGRRRRVDPTTCDREYSAAELEFMQAIQTYKHVSGRLYPTWSEVLEVLKKLGYRKPAADVEAHLAG